MKLLFSILFALFLFQSGFSNGTAYAAQTNHNGLQEEHIQHVSIFSDNDSKSPLMNIPINLRRFDENHTIPILSTLSSETSNDTMPLVFVRGTIPADKFEIRGLPDDVDSEEFLKDWSYTADGRPIDSVPLSPDGTRPASRFPEYAGYHFVNVTIDNVEATQLGILKLSEFLGDRGIKYYYLTQSVDGQYETSSTILEDDQKFTINYAYDEFNITYEAKMADGSELIEEADPDKIFGTNRQIETINHSYTFNASIPYGYKAHIYRTIESEDGTKNTEELFPEHNNGYPLGTEPVYVQVDRYNVKADMSQGPSSMLVSDSFYESDVRKDCHITIELEKNPSPVFNTSQWLHTEYTGGYTGGTDSHRGTSAAYGFNWNEYYSQGNKADIIPEGNYNWGSLYEESKDMVLEDDGTYSYSWTFQTNTHMGNTNGFVLDTLEVNGVSLIVPFYPTLTDPDDDLLGFEKHKEGIGEVEGKSVTTTILPDGTKITLEYLYVFHGVNPNDQRIYRVSASNAVCNVTITGGNLMIHTMGAPEFVTYSFEGIHADVEGVSSNRQPQHPAIQAYRAPDDRWLDFPMSNVFINNYSNYYDGDNQLYGANIRFKLADGYTAPYYSLESIYTGIVDGIDGKPQASVTKDEEGKILNKNEVKELPAKEDTIESQYVYGPDSDGWYYIRITKQGDFANGNPDDDHRIALLFIGTTPVNYVLRYLPGEVDSTISGTVPSFTHDDVIWNSVDNSEQYNTNSGQYYNIKNNKIITIDERTPVDENQQSSVTGKIFRYWTFVGNEHNPDGTYIPLDENIKLYPGEAFSMEDYGSTITNLVDDSVTPGFAVKDTELEDAGINARVLQLLPVWDPTPDPFKYTVWIQYIDEKGILHKVSEPADEVITENDYHVGEQLSIGVNLDAPVFVNWLKNNPYYHFSDDNSDVHDIDDDGNIFITFEAKNGALLLKKEVTGDSQGEKSFKFSITGPDNLNENFLAWDANIPIDDRTNDDMIVVPFNAGKAEITLEAGQEIILYVPQGKYSIVENNDTGKEHVVQINGKYFDETEIPQITTDLSIGEETPISFNNIYDISSIGKIKVRKTVSGTAGETDRAFKFEAKIGDDTQTFTLSDGDIWTSAYYDTDTSYSVIELDANKDDYTTTYSDNYTGTISNTDTPTIEFENHKDLKEPGTDVEDPTARITVHKVIEGNAGETDRDFNFVAVIDDNTYNFTLKDGQSWTSDYFMEGKSYSVNEVEANQDGYVTTTSNNENGTLQENKTTEIIFTNTKEDIPSVSYGKIIVSKKVTGENIDTDKRFRFEALIGEQNYDFSLADGETWTSDDFEDGISYSIVELDANKDGYLTTIPSNDSGKIVGEQTISVDFINHKDNTVPDDLNPTLPTEPDEPDDGENNNPPNTEPDDDPDDNPDDVIPDNPDEVLPTPIQPEKEAAKIIVKKTVEGELGETDRAFHFQLIINDETIYEFELSDGQTWISNELEKGTGYEIVELEANTDGYTTIISGESKGIIENNEDIQIEFINRKGITNQGMNNVSSSIIKPSITTPENTLVKTNDLYNPQLLIGLSITSLIIGIFTYIIRRKHS